MRFPNAYRGISKLFAAEILKLIAAGLLFAAGIAGIIGSGSYLVDMAKTSQITEEAVQGIVSSPGVIAAAFLSVGAMILLIIAYIMNIVGLGQAGKDEPNFRNAFIVSIVVLAITVVAAFLSGTNVAGGAGSDITNTIMRACEIFVMISVVVGIMNLSNAFNNGGMYEFGRKIIIIVIISIGIALAVNFISIFFWNNSAIAIVDGILALIGAVAMFVGYIAYIIYLAKAKRMLREDG